MKLNLPYVFYSEYVDSEISILVHHWSLTPVSGSRYYLFLRLVDHSLSISDQAGDARMELWLEHSLEVRMWVSNTSTLTDQSPRHQDQTYRVTAFDSIVVIVEPEISWLDWKMSVVLFSSSPDRRNVDYWSRWSTYLVIAGLLGGLSYFAFITFSPQPKKRSKKFTPAVSAPVGTVTATGAGGYQEEWIPEHHLRKGKKTKQANAASGTSADELNDGQVSTTEGKKRKGRK